MGAFDHLEWTYDGAFEQLFGLGRGEFEQKFSKNSNAGGLPGGGGRMLKLRFDWYITAQAPVVRKPISANPRLNRPYPRNKFILQLNSVRYC